MRSKLVILLTSLIIMLLVEAAWVGDMLFLRVLHLCRMAEGLLAGVVKQIRVNVLVLHLHHLLLLPRLSRV